jgi:hypothetical protein
MNLNKQSEAANDAFGAAHADIVAHRWRPTRAAQRRHKALVKSSFCMRFLA